MVNLKDTYNRIAEDWVRDHDLDTWWQEGTNYFLSLLPPHAKVLDIGCGGGIKTNYMAQRGFDATGIDFSEKMIALARTRYPQVGFAVMDMYEAHTLAEKFDGIFMQATLLHVRKAEVLPLLKNIITLLAPGGLLYLAVKAVREDGKEEAVRSEDDYGYTYERFFSYFTPEELKEYYRQLNLEVVSDGMKRVSQTNWLHSIGKRATH
ncbi:methyltransferase domain-containing protein [Patescibacteria group bacterium]|nr:methyltransferase domain-containing protein [Patescibacteria group bacterium]